MGLLATAYQTSASLLLKLSDHGNAWLAVGRAMAEAERCGDPVILASSVRVHAHLLAREKHTTQAVTLVRHTADQLTGAYDQRSPRYLAALGLLLLRGVTAASSGGDRSAAKDFLTEATDVARYVALDRPDAWANFSPTNVALHAVSAANAFGDAGVALETAGPLMRRHISCPRAPGSPLGGGRPRLQPARPSRRRLPGPPDCRELRGPGRSPPRRPRIGRRHGRPRPPPYPAGTAPLQPSTGNPA